MKPKKNRKPKKKTVQRTKAQRVDLMDVLVLGADSLFKGRKSGDFSISEDSTDEQMQGFLSDFCARAPSYVEQGAFIMQGKDGRWKVVVFGGSDFEDVMGKVIRIGILGLAQGHEDA